MYHNFISFEGGEGAGKTTVIEAVENYLVNKGFEIIKTREPGGIKISESIREIILDTNNTEMDGRTEALLYAAARRQHLVEKVIPALKEGKIVLCDRYIDSSLVYQGLARKLGLDEVYKINLFAIENCLPKLTIYYDVSPEIGLDRIAKNAQREVNRLDQEKIDFHYKVRNGYLQVAKMFPERIVTVNAEQPLELVVERTKQLVEMHLANTKGKD